MTYKNFIEHLFGWGWFFDPLKLSENTYEGIIVISTIYLIMSVIFLIYTIAIWFNNIRIKPYFVHILIIPTYILSHSVSSALSFLTINLVGMEYKVWASVVGIFTIVFIITVFVYTVFEGEEDGTFNIFGSIKAYGSDLSEYINEKQIAENNYKDLTNKII